MEDNPELEKVLDEAREFISKFKLVNGNKLPPLPEENHESFDPVHTRPGSYDDPHPFEDDDDIEFHNLTPEQEAVLVAWEEKRANRRQQIFINEMIAHGHRRLAYQRAYPKVSDETARANACRLLARKNISRPILEGVLEKKKQADELLRQEYAGRIADMEEKRAALARIIRGEFAIEKEVKKNGLPETITQKPDMKDVLKAIVVDNRMEDEWKKVLDIPDEGLKIWK